MHARWLAQNFHREFKEFRNWKLIEIQRYVKSKWEVNVSIDKCYRARQLALEELSVNMKEHYAKLLRYIEELKRSNSGIHVDLFQNFHTGKPEFRRLYIGFKALRTGFLAGYRNIIGLDGCFLKGVCGGQLLSAIGRDGNNQMFPISWVVVEGENRDSWEWFLNLLREDLQLDDGDGWTFISDQQKVIYFTLALLILI